MTPQSAALEFKPLADLARDELLEVLGIRNQDGVRRYMYTCHVISEAEHFAWVERAIVDDTLAFFAVLNEDRIIGGAAFSSINPIHKRADLGVYLGEGHQGRGLGPALEIACLDYAFGALGLEKLNGEVLAFNDRTIKVHLRFGFQHEGVRRRHILRDGAWIDAHLVGLTREEWTAQRARPAIARLRDRVG